MEGKRGERVSIYKHETNVPDHQIMLDKRSRVEIKQSDRLWAFKRHPKEFEINGQDGGAIMVKRRTRVLKALFMGKRIASLYTAYSQKMR